MANRGNAIVQNTIVWSFTLVMLTMVCYSLHFGITPLDEPYFVSIPYRFILGDRPFIDEWKISQLSSFFILPFLKLYLIYKESTEGILLFARYLHFVSTFLLAGLVYLCFKRITNLNTAILLSLPCIVFVPFNLHALSHDTLGMMFLTAGYFLGFLAVLSFSSVQSQPNTVRNAKRSNFLLGCSGACHISAAICYPPMLVIPIIFTFCLLYCMPRKQTIMSYGAGLLIGASWLLVILIRTGLEQLLVIYQLAQSTKSNTSFFSHFGYFALVFNKHKEFFLYVLPGVTLIISSLTFFSIKIFKISIAKISLPFVILAFVGGLIFNNYGNGAVFFIFNIAGFAILLFAFSFKSNDLCVKQLFILICVPSFVAAIIPTITSSSSIITGVIGIFPCMLIGFYYMTIQKTPSHDQEELNSLSTIQLLIFILVISGLQYFNLRHPYGSDLSPLRLNTKFMSGPFKGIYTTEDTHHYFTQLEQDVKQIYHSDRSILFFDNFPAGYLFSDMRPATNSTWVLPGSFSLLNRQILFNYLKAHKPSYIVKILEFPLSKNYLKYKQYLFAYDQHDPVNQFTNKNYQCIIKRSGYEIYKNIS